MTINLTLNDRCYTHYLLENKPRLDRMLEDDSVSHMDMMKEVAEIIYPAGYNNVAKPRFYGYIFGTKDKLDLYKLCLNSILKAENYKEKNKSKYVV